jgi:predicted DNA-binding transcriptional regulator YafY
MILILLLVEAKGKIKAKELAEELETSVRTIYRDVDALCEAGIPLTTDTGPNGGIYFLEGYTVGINNLNGEDIINLYINGMGVKADKQSDMAMKVNSALLKLQKNLSSELNKDLNVVRKRFYVDDFPWWGEKQKLHNIDVIMEAVWQSKKLRITYKKHEGQMTERIIRPYGIVINEMDWYLIAYCEKSNNIRTFKCQRITECQFQIEKFIVPDNFSVEEFWKKSKQLFISECSQSEKYPVTIRIDKHRVKLLKNFEIYEIKEGIECIEATINMYKYEFAKYDILEIIGQVEVLKPAELRNYVEQELRNMLSRYKEGAVVPVILE